jgi:hypothetical protein
MMRWTRHDARMTDQTTYEILGRTAARIRGTLRHTGDNIKMDSKEIEREVG